MSIKLTHPLSVIVAEIFGGAASITSTGRDQNTVIVVAVLYWCTTTIPVTDKVFLERRGRVVE